MYEDRAVVGRRIRQARRELGLTQAELATRIGVSLGVLDRFETGKADPSGKLEPIAEVTGRPVSWYAATDQYDAGDGAYGTGLPAELRRRLAESSDRRTTADAELAEERDGAALGEPDVRPTRGSPAREDAEPDLAAPSEDLREEREALAQQEELQAASAAEQQEHAARAAQMAEELERVNANEQALVETLEQSRSELATSRAQQAELTQRVSQLETELRVVEERAAEAGARLGRAETELESMRDRERSRAEELDLRNAGLTLWADELNKREIALAEAEGDVEARGRALGEVERRAVTTEPREETAHPREDEPARRARTGLARRLDRFKGKAGVVEDRPPARENVHLLVAPDHGYRLVAREGAAPDPGSIVKLNGVHYRCLRIQGSPFLGDDRPLAVLELLPPPSEPEPSRSTERPVE